MGLRRGVGGSALAETIRVPDDAATIQEAIDRAVDGDVILLTPGTYGGPGNVNLDTDPLFTLGPEGEYYLSQVAAGQPLDTPCLDAGAVQAKQAGLKKTTTRTDGVKDKREADLGFHYPQP